MMNKKIIFLVLVSLPMTLPAADTDWISGNILYSDDDCGDPVAYVDDGGNVVGKFTPEVDTEISLNDSMSATGILESDSQRPE